MATLVQGLYQPLRAFATRNYTDKHTAQLAATALKIGLAVATYFAFAYVMAQITSSWMALGAGAVIYIGMQFLTNPEISDTAIGAWLLVTGIQQIAAKTLWQMTGLGVAKAMFGVLILSVSDGVPLTPPLLNVDRFINRT